MFMDVWTFVDGDHLWRLHLQVGFGGNLIVAVIDKGLRAFAPVCWLGVSPLPGGAVPHEDVVWPLGRPRRLQHAELHSRPRSFAPRPPPGSLCCPHGCRRWRKRVFLPLGPVDRKSRRPASGRRLWFLSGRPGRHRRSLPLRVGRVGAVAPNASIRLRGSRGPRPDGPRGLGGRLGRRVRRRRRSAWRCPVGR